MRFVWLGLAFYCVVHNLSGGDLKLVLPPHPNLESWLERRVEIRNQILSAAGLIPFPESTPLHARRFGRSEARSFAVEKVTVETLPGFRLAGNLYLPLKVKGKLPAVLLAHGHWKNGRIHDAKRYSVPALAATLAARGYVVFAYDMIGYNDTQQLPHRFGETSREMLWSFGPLGLQLWNSRRALDYLASLEEVDSTRIGMTGFSGGGLQTLLLTAVDDRIAVAAPGGMVSASFQGDDACEEAAGLHVGLNNVEIAAVAAPRPLLLISATRDWTRHTPNKELPAVRSVYRLFTADSNVENAHISGWHNGNRESRKAIYTFFDRKLKGAASVGSASEVSLTKIRLENLLIGSAVEKDEGQLFSQWQRQAVRQAAMLSGRENRARLRIALAIESLPLGMIKSRWMMGTGKGAVLIVHPAGIEAAVESPEATRLYDQTRSILFVEFDKPHDDSGHKRAHLTFHLSEDAQRVRVLLSAITLLATQRKEKPQVACLGESGPWCLAAAAASEYPVDLIADLKGFDSSDESLSRHLFIPGLQRLGGVSMLENLAGISIREERTVSLLR